VIILTDFFLTLNISSYSRDRTCDLSINGIIS
jgi:hypothetical protein